MTAWWVSYALEDGRAFVAIVDAPSFLEACMKARQIGVSPGGEVLGFEIPEDAREHALPRDRLLTAEEISGSGARRLGDVDGSN